MLMPNKNIIVQDVIDLYQKWDYADIVHLMINTIEYQKNRNMKLIISDVDSKTFLRSDKKVQYELYISSPESIEPHIEKIKRMLSWATVAILNLEQEIKEQQKP
jgi:hypothetical protein